MANALGCNQFQHKCGLNGGHAGWGDITDETVARAEADGAAWDSMLAAESSELRVLLATIGVSGLNERFGFDHSNFEAKYGPLDDLSPAEGLPGVPALPRPEPSAGTVTGLVVRRVRGDTPTAQWNFVQGLILRWADESGDATARTRFARALGDWLLAFCEAAQRHLGSPAARRG